MPSRLDGARRSVRPRPCRCRSATRASRRGLLGVPVGAVVAFPNDDDIFHNVFSLSPGHAFDLGLYRAGASKSRTFASPGVVRVFCNIHPQMTALVVVVPTPWIAAAGADGACRLDLPPGRYTVTALSERAAPVTIDVTVAGATTAPLLGARRERTSWPSRTPTSSASRIRPPPTSPDAVYRRSMPDTSDGPRTIPASPSSRRCCLPGASRRVWSCTGCGRLPPGLRGCRASSWLAWRWSSRPRSAWAANGRCTAPAPTCGPICRRPPSSPAASTASRVIRSISRCCYIYTAVALFTNALWPFVLWAVLLPVLVKGIVEREERYLERKFGQPYLDYKARVRRWI